MEKLTIFARSAETNSAYDQVPLCAVYRGQDAVPGRCEISFFSLFACPRRIGGIFWNFQSHYVILTPALFCYPIDHVVCYFVLLAGTTRTLGQVGTVASMHPGGRLGWLSIGKDGVYD
jgi:hypothetical protein